jgi:hypothetical protein
MLCVIAAAPFASSSLTPEKSALGLPPPMRAAARELLLFFLWRDASALTLRHFDRRFCLRTAVTAPLGTRLRRGHAMPPLGTVQETVPRSIGEAVTFPTPRGLVLEFHPNRRGRLARKYVVPRSRSWVASGDRPPDPAPERLTRAHRPTACSAKNGRDCEINQWQEEEPPREALTVRQPILEENMAVPNNTVMFVIGSKKIDRGEEERQELRPKRR